MATDTHKEWRVERHIVVGGGHFGSAVSKGQLKSKGEKKTPSVQVEGKKEGNKSRRRVKS